MKGLFVILFLMTTTAFAQKNNIRYEYKKYEKFDFESIGVEGEAGSPLLWWPLGQGALLAGIY
jgi:hypothetical protein